MLTEMLGKGGNLCSHAKSGEIRCPLIIRPTSEDVITGHLFQMLGYINPRWWLPDLLNAGLGADRFRRQVFRDLKVRLWQNQPCYPKELLPWDEGSSQIDVVLSWENPPTTVYIEAKYGSGLSEFVAGDDGSSGYPSDQLIRNIRVGLLQSGYFDEGGQLFDQPPRDFVVLVLSPFNGHALVEQYRDRERLKEAIPHSDRLIGFPPGPFVGQVDYEGIRGILDVQFRYLTHPERRVARELGEYLDFKRTNRPTKPGERAQKPGGSSVSSGPDSPSSRLKILTVG